MNAQRKAVVMQEVESILWTLDLMLIKPSIKDGARSIVEELNAKYQLFLNYPHRPDLKDKLILDIASTMTDQIDRFREGEIAHISELVVSCIYSNGFAPIEPEFEFPIAWLTLDQVSDYLKKSPDDVRQLCRKGEFTHKTVDKRLWVQSSSIIGYLVRQGRQDH